MSLPPKGTRVRLDHMPDDPDPIAPGSLGTVTGVSSCRPGAQIWVKWDSGRSLNLIPGTDRFTIISEPKENP